MPIFEGQPLFVRSLASSSGPSLPAASPFDPDIKRQWAKKHLDELQTRIKAFCDSHPCEVLGEENLDAGFIQITTVHPPILNPLALEAALALGDFVNCLRGALDHLAWQLSCISGKRPSREICFPIYEQNTIDIQIRITKATFGIPDDAITIIKSFQPYHAGKDFKSNHLWRLNTLWNIDKHRHIAPTSTFTTWQYCLRNGYRDGDTLPIEQFDNRTILTLPIAYKGELDFNTDLTGELRFSDALEGIDVGPSELIEMYEFVANEVLPAFSRFFPVPEVSGPAS